MLVWCQRGTHCGLPACFVTAATVPSVIESPMAGTTTFTASHEAGLVWMLLNSNEVGAHGALVIVLDGLHGQQADLSSGRDQLHRG